MIPATFSSNKTSLVFCSLRSQNPLHLGGGRPLSVRLRLPPSPTRRTRPFCRFATFSPFHRGHLPVSSGEPAPKGKARGVRSFAGKVFSFNKNFKKIYLVFFGKFYKTYRLAFPFGEGVNEVDERGQNKCSSLYKTKVFRDVGGAVPYGKNSVRIRVYKKLSQMLENSNRQ